MGTINYKTSDVITLVFDTYYADYDFIRDYLSEDSDDEINDDDILYELGQIIWDKGLETEDFINYNIYLRNMDFFEVELKDGYYEGIQVIISDKTKYGFDCSQDKRQALKEASKIKDILHYIVSEYGFTACSPSWCPAYYDTKQTHARIDTAIKELKNRIKKEDITA